MSLLIGYANGTFQNQTKSTTGKGPTCIISTHLTKNNKFDVIVTNSNSQDLSVFINHCKEDNY